MAWRVLANGAMIETATGQRDLPGGGTAEVTSIQIYREGQIIKNELSKSMIDRYEANDDYVHSIVERVKLVEGEDGEENTYVADGSSTSSATVDTSDTDAVHAAEVADLNSQIDDLTKQLAAVQADLDTAQADAANAPAMDYSRLSPEALEAEVAKRGLTPLGTGSSGNVLKVDNVKALTEDDAAKA